MSLDTRGIQPPSKSTTEGTKVPGNSNSLRVSLRLSVNSCLKREYLPGSLTSLRHFQPLHCLHNGIFCDSIHQPDSQRLRGMNLLGGNEHFQGL